jgi:small subunit ribosomal protein S30e
MPTHGSLTKAGKVRAQTPKIEGIPKKHVAPKKRNQANFSKRITNAQEDRFGGNRRRRD